MFCEEQLFKKQKQPVRQTPDREHPSRAVPEARQRPDDEDIQNPARRADAVAAQRNVDILAEPAAQGHVPAPPELGDRPGDEGVVEVLGEGEAEEAPQPDGHVAVPAEVEVELQGEGDPVHPVKQHRLLRRWLPEKQLDELPQLVGDEHLLAEADEETPSALVQVLGRGAAGQRVELSLDGAVDDDRTGDELREQGHVHGEPQKIALRGVCAAMHVDGVA